MSMDIRIIFITLFSLLLYSYDLVSDILLAIAYSREANHTTEFALTTAYVAVPTVICNAICAYYIRLEISAWNFATFLQFIFTFPFLLGPIVRHVKTLVNTCRGKDTSRVQAHTALVTLLEGYLESASQLILQLYLSITTDHEEDITTRVLRYAAMIGSAVGLAWSLVAVRRTNRTLDLDEENDETICGSIFNFLARVAEVGPRIVLMALFAAKFTFYAFILGGVHWFVCSTWVFLIDKTRERKNVMNIVLKILIGYPMIFCFVDLDYVYSDTDREHVPTRYKMLLYYIVFYLENWTMFGLWITTTENASKWFYPASITVVVCGMVLHIVLQLLYYKVCHPNSHQIPVTMSIRKSSCLYHEDDPDDKVV